MAFSISSYNKSKEKIISDIKSIHDWENTEGFIADGVIRPLIYANQRLKILAVLAESYGYNACKCINIEDQGKKDVIDSDVLGIKNPRVQTPRKLSSMLYLLLTSLDQMSKIKREDFLPLFQIRKYHTEILNSTLEKFAWINIKKASNPNSKKNTDDIRKHAQKNCKIIKEQIDSISPDLILIFGKDVSSSLCELDITPSPIAEKIKSNIKKHESIMYRELTHPASKQWWSYNGVYNIYENIYDQIV